MCLLVNFESTFVSISVLFTLFRIASENQNIRIRPIIKILYLIKPPSDVFI